MRSVVRRDISLLRLMPRLGLFASPCAGGPTNAPAGTPAVKANQALLQIVADVRKLDCNGGSAIMPLKSASLIAFIARRREKSQPNPSRTTPCHSHCGHPRKHVPLRRHWPLSQAGCHRGPASRSTTTATCTATPHNLPESFWATLWDYAEVRGAKGEAPFLVDANKMPGARFFPEARLNYAENLLVNGTRRRSSSGARTRSAAHELGGPPAASRRSLQALLTDAGVAAGDRVGRDPAQHARGASSVFLARRRSERSGRPARPISASQACSIASARSSPRC